MKRSRAYRAIRARVAAPFPSDSWSEGGVAYVTFALRPPPGEAPPEASGSQAIFAVAIAGGEILVARTVEPRDGGGPARVDDLLIAAADDPVSGRCRDSEASPSVGK